MAVSFGKQEEDSDDDWVDADAEGEEKNALKVYWNHKEGKRGT